MKKVFLLLLLFSAKTLSAQSLSLGGAILGAENYQFRQLPVFNNSNTGLCFSVTGQYTFKDSCFGVESDLVYSLSGIPKPFIDFGFDGSIASTASLNLTTTDYFVYTPFPKQKIIKLQLKAGLFCSPLNDDYGTHFTDWGPAVSIFAGVKISKKCTWGFDVTQLVGTQNFTFPGLILNNIWQYSPSGSNTIPSTSSQLSYTLIQLKLIYKL